MAGWGDSLTKLGGVLAVVASAAAASVLGGIVFAIRLGKASLPVEEALNSIPRETLVLVGVRELLLAGAIAVALLLLSRSLVVAVSAAVALAAVAPLSFAGFAWVAAISGVALLVKKVKKPEVVLVIVFLVAGITTSLRFIDGPYGFPRARVVRAVEHSPACTPVEGDLVCGAYLGRTGDGIYLGYPDQDLIVFVPSEGVRGIVLDPPPPARPPRTSFLGRLVDRVGPSISLTPLDWWVDGEYGGVPLFR